MFAWLQQYLDWMWKSYICFFIQFHLKPCHLDNQIIAIRYKYQSCIIIISRNTWTLLKGCKFLSFQSYSTKVYSNVCITICHQENRIDDCTIMCWNSVFNVDMENVALRGRNARRFYLLLYITTLRTILLLPLIAPLDFLNTCLKGLFSNILFFMLNLYQWE